jgi:hypothetical protein
MFQPDTTPSAAEPGLSLGQNTIGAVLEFVFSWMVLLAIGVIVTGKLLTQRFRPDVGAGQLFRIPLKGLFTIEATGPEVILGFTWYLICLLSLGTVVGRDVQTWVKAHFGIDPGQFNALGFMSSLLSVTTSFIVYLLFGAPQHLGRDSALAEHDKVVNELTRKHTGQDPEQLPKVEQ